MQSRISENEIAIVKFFLVFHNRIIMESESRTPLDPRITEICNILWGNNVTNDIFQRWSQGNWNWY